MSQGPDLLQAVLLQLEVYSRIIRIWDLFHDQDTNSNWSFAKTPPISRRAIVLIDW